MIGAKFQDMLASFSKEYCDQFHPDEENRLEYTPIFQKWTSTIEVPDTVRRMFLKIPGAWAWEKRG